MQIIYYVSDIAVGILKDAKWIKGMAPALNLGMVQKIDRSTR